jgi:monoamine oxidase
MAHVVILGAGLGGMPAAYEMRKALGIAVFAIGLGDDADPRMLLQVAGEPSRYYHAPRVEDLAGIYRRVAGIVGCR